MVDVSAKTNILFKTNTPLLTVVAFVAGAIQFAFEGRLLPEGLWIGSTYGCFVASTFFGIVAWRQGKRWPLIFAALSALIIIVTAVGIFFIGGV
jgi:Mg/Co/Ni transporter MgtE